MTKSITYVVVIGWDYHDEEVTVRIPRETFIEARNAAEAYQTSFGTTQYMYSPSDSAIVTLTGFYIAQAWRVRYHHSFSSRHSHK